MDDSTPPPPVDLRRRIFGRKPAWRMSYRLLTFLVPFTVCILALSVKSLPLPNKSEVRRTVELNNEDFDMLREMREEITVSGIRIENYQQKKHSAFLGYNSRSHSIVKPNELVRVVIFGSGFSHLRKLKFSGSQSCDGNEKAFSEADFTIMTPTRLVIVTSFEKLVNEEDVYRLCIARKRMGRQLPYTQIDDPFTIISTKVPEKNFMFPLYISCPLLFCLLCLSGLFSGLNLGLMTLTPYELQLYIKSGTPREKYYAERILPVRKRGNILLCTLLLGNVVVNSAVSLLLDDLLEGNGAFALIASTIGIVIFGEIVPQAICVKRGLEVGSYTVPLTRVIVALMYPITWVISMVLDFFLKEELTQPLGRKKLVEMMKMSTMTDACEGNDDFRMALGALEIVDKTAKHAMTKIEDVFMLESTLKLTPVTMNQILETGYTRIPIYENDRNNVVDLLFIKDLALLDPDDNMDVMKVCSVYKHQLRIVDEDTPLRVLLDEFKKGEYHLAMVHRVVCHDDADPTYELVGLITLEDIIEEIIQSEILDETDAVCDNVHRKKRQKKRNAHLPQIVDIKSKCAISVQMQIVVVQFLSTFHPIFSPKYIAPLVLEKLVQKNVRRVENAYFSCLNQQRTPPQPAVLYTNGEFSDKFVLFLEGGSLVNVGKEHMLLETKAWQHIGLEVLEGLIRAIREEEEKSGSPSLSFANELKVQKKIGFVPDFTAVVRNECTFFELNVSDYCTAFKASILNNSTSEVPLSRSQSRVSLVEDVSSKNSSPHKHCPRLRSCSDSETSALLMNGTELTDLTFTEKTPLATSAV
ncbi:unnamed protein product [Caenorhabditis bovis]|uniref:Metal transporter n=1 Tax=Caenorhabditis bovis TaxID=2654633 RepID=A0A8S1ECG3_9PELO|nr:unnamed protein product [Caenorhabditis bovis]